MANVNVNVLATPAVTISASSDTLITTSGTSFQWYFNGSVIPGATDQTYIANETGEFTVYVVFSNGCSGLSEPYTMNFVTLDEMDLQAIHLYPNPAISVLNLELLNRLDGEFIVNISDHSGRVVLSEVHILDDNIKIDISTLAPGFYYLAIEGNYQVSNIRFVKVDQ